MMAEEERNELEQALVLQAMKDYNRAVKKHDEKLRRECERFLLHKESTENLGLLVKSAGLYEKSLQS